MSHEDYYEVLGVLPGANEEAIQAAYRAACKKYHPDTGRPGASVAMMTRINEAYAVLSDGRRRAEYDAALALHVRSRARTSRRVRRRTGDMALELGPDLIMPLVRVSGGDFLMGDCLPAAGHADGVQVASNLYTLSLPEFYIGIYPVTVAQYAAFARATGRRSTVWARRSYSYDPDELDDPYTVTRLDRNWQHPFGSRSTVSGKGDHPVMVVDWFDATAFCKWACEITGAQVRLPSTAEWQKAARGPDGRPYPWGQGPEANRRLCNCLDDAVPAHRRREDTTPVGLYSPQGDSPYGCADMLGNVWEWTSTRSRDSRGALLFGHPYRADDGREDPQARDFRVLMGGSLMTGCEVLCCGVEREQQPLRAQDTGFRVCVTP